MPRASSRPENRRSPGLPVRPEFFAIRAQAARRQADHPDHRRQPGIAHAERSRARQLELFSRGSRFQSGSSIKPERPAHAVLAQEIRRKRNGGRSGAVHRRHAGGVCARRPGDLPRGSGRGGGTGGRRQAVHPGSSCPPPPTSISFATRKRSRRPARRCWCSIRKWMADGCLRKWRSCARSRNC